MNQLSKQGAPLGGNGIEGHSTRGEGSAFWFEAELGKASTLRVEGAPTNGADFHGSDLLDGAASRLTLRGHDTTYDRKHLLDSVDGNVVLAREIVTLYLSESPGLVTELGNKVKRQDREGIESAAHRLRGAMLAMGAGAAAIAGDLEELAAVGHGGGDRIQAPSLRLQPERNHRRARRVEPCTPTVARRLGQTPSTSA